ncbi:MAG: TonB-dependent receptor [Thermonemataceae bacterium]|nr:TonB-dependent receptor [Thermonemataceae bacterium]
MEDDKLIGARQKALQINLDNSIYGSFAEIGAGQETAAIFFKAGGASGTIAKTMSAYDMTFSDAIYGKEESGRYVCEPRLAKMLAKEYSLMEVRLGEKRGSTTKFFAFADTVTTINFSKTVQGHGWLGLRFQLSPQAEANEVIIHVRMNDKEAVQQQQAYGILGVNLIFACFYYHQDPDKFIQSLMDNLSRERVEIDMIRFEGKDFEHIDNRLVTLKLVLYGLADAAMFSPDAEMLQPADALYKKNVLILRGRFRPVTHVNMDMFRKAKRQFLTDLDPDEHVRTTVLAELTLQDLKKASNITNQIDIQDFLDRVDILCTLGQNVMISNFDEPHKLISYISQHTKKQIAIVIGRLLLEEIIKPDKYEKLKGGILEAFSSLFINDLHVYVYPYLKEGEAQTFDNFDVPPSLAPLVEYLRINNKVSDIVDYDEEVLGIYSEKVLEMIRTNEEGWEEMVPEVVAEKIKNNCLFGFPCVVVGNKKRFNEDTHS